MTSCILAPTRYVPCMRFSLARLVRPSVAVPRAIGHAPGLCSTTPNRTDSSQVHQPPPPPPSPPPLENLDQQDEPLQQPPLPEARWELRPQSALSGLSERAKATLERDFKPALRAKQYSHIMNGYQIPPDLPTYIFIARFSSDNIKHLKRLLHRPPLTIFQHQESNYLKTWVVRFSTHEDALHEMNRLHGTTVSGRRLRVGFWLSKAASSLVRLRQLPSSTPMNEVYDAFQFPPPLVNDPKVPKPPRIQRPYMVTLQGSAKDNGKDQAFMWHTPRSEFDLQTVCSLNETTLTDPGPNLTCTSKFPYMIYAGTDTMHPHHLTPLVWVKKLPPKTSVQDVIELFGTLVPVRAAYIAPTRRNEALVEVPTLAYARQACAFDNYRYGDHHLSVQVHPRKQQSNLKTEALQQTALPFVPSDDLSEYPYNMRKYVLPYRRFVQTYGQPNQYAITADEPEAFRHPVSKPLAKKQKSDPDWDRFVLESEPDEGEPNGGRLGQPNEFPL